MIKGLSPLPMQQLQQMFDETNHANPNRPRANKTYDARQHHRILGSGGPRNNQNANQIHMGNNIRSESRQTSQQTQAHST